MKKILEIEKKVIALQKQRDAMLCRHDCTVFSKIWDAMLKCISFTNCGVANPICAFECIYKEAYKLAQDSDASNDCVIICCFRCDLVTEHQNIILDMRTLPPLEAASPLQYFATKQYLSSCDDDLKSLKNKLDNLDSRLKLIIELCRRVSIIEILKAQRREASLLERKTELENQLGLSSEA